MKTCPKCQELIGDQATTCFQCGYVFLNGGSFQYVCMDCGKPLPFAYSNCQCGGRATSQHPVQNLDSSDYKKESRLAWLFNKKHLRIKIIILIVSIILIPLYFITFFTKGIYFEDIFMKINQKNNSITYSGKQYSEDITVIVTNDYNTNLSKYVEFNFPKNIKKTYIINYINKDHWQNGFILKTDDGETIYEGFYDGNFLYKKGDPSPDINFIISTDYQQTLDENYKISPYIIISFAFGLDVRYRGNIVLLAIAIILLIITFIDYMFPLFFFRLEHLIDVRNPEPSDFYLFIQRLSWILMPIISVIIMIVALFNDLTL
jgi:hypothetical protein